MILTEEWHDDNLETLFIVVVRSIGFRIESPVEP